MERRGKAVTDEIIIDAADRCASIVLQGLVEICEELGLELGGDREKRVRRVLIDVVQQGVKLGAAELAAIFIERGAVGLRLHFSDDVTPDDIER
jgi:hypothetical protein